MKTNYLIVASAVGGFAALGLAFRAPNALAAPDPKCWSGAKPLDPVAPDIPSDVLKHVKPDTQAAALVTVDASCHASNVKVVESSGNATIDRALTQAAQTTTYKPEMHNCKPVSDGKYLFHIELSSQ